MIHEENNPLGLIRIDHLEFTTGDLNGSTSKVFRHLGLAKTFENPHTNSVLYSGHDINFVLTNHPDHNSQQRSYFKKHGEGVCKISFLVDNAEWALDMAIKRGGQLTYDFQCVETEHGTFKRGSIQGFGDVINEFVERPRHHFHALFTKVEKDPLETPLKSSLIRIDHLTNNVPKGQMEHWVEFYQRIFGFKVTRYFDIKGLKTGLVSKVVQLANGAIIIPINEPEVHDGKSQIQEFLDRHQGPGVQHIALTAHDIVGTVGELKNRGIRFLDIPHTYYEDIPKRKLPIHENVGELEKSAILVDGDDKGYLLQIFSDTYIGPAFFEIIQRKGHWGFGEGNFQALFDAIERDQMQRGYLT